MLKTVQVSENQRTDALDMNRVGQFERDNLYSALRYLLLPQPGWLQLGALDYVGPGMQCILRAPTAAITSQGIALLLADHALTPANGNPLNPRIDLVSIGWTETDTDEEERIFRNPLDNSKYPQNVYTTRTQSAVIALTPGVPAVNPVPPPPPANHVPLYHIYVDAGATTLSAGKFSPAATSVPTPRLTRAVWTGTGTHPLPYVTPTLLSVSAPGQLTIFLASVHYSALLSGGGAGDMTTVKTPLSFELEDGTTNTVIGRTEVQPVAGFRATTFVIGVVVGTTGPRNYRMRVRNTFGVGFDVNTHIALPPIYADGQPTKNEIVCLSV